MKKLTQQYIESKGWVFKNTNGIRHWFTLKSPGRIHPNYGHQFYDLTMIYDFTNYTMKIENFEEVFFQGIVRTESEFNMLLNLTNISQVVTDDNLEMIPYYNNKGKLASYEFIEFSGGFGPNIKKNEDGSFEMEINGAGWRYGINHEEE